MLYEPLKTKQYIIIGAGAVALAVLVIVFAPLIFRNKTTQNPTANLPLATKQKEIQKEQNKLIEMTKKQKDAVLSAEDIRKEQGKLIEETKANGTSKTPENIREDQDNLINAAK